MWRIAADAAAGKMEETCARAVDKACIQSESPPAKEKDPVCVRESEKKINNNAGSEGSGEEESEDPDAPAAEDKKRPKKPSSAIVDEGQNNKRSKVETAKCSYDW